MQLYKVRLKFTAPLHISANGVPFERISQIIHSDTLFGAIVSTWQHLYPEDMESLFKVQQHIPPILISSAFPYWKDWEFYPRPLSLRLPPTHETPPNMSLAKKFKRVQFLDKRIFFQIVNGEIPEFSPTQTLSEGKFWCSSQEALSQKVYILRQEETPRITVDRYTNNASNYFVSELYFEPGAGLFFLVRFTDISWQSKFIAVLRLLGDEGLGLDRHCGKGFFEIDNFVPYTLPKPIIARKFLTLSLFHPTENEIRSSLLDCASYELVQRGGWINSGWGSPYRRQTLTMFAEGSVFSGSPNQFYGDTPQVLPENFAQKFLTHPVFRYGYAFPVGLA